ncbi:MAG: cell division protein ZapE [Hahellaceae bacterium]|nr:cell division protein ZapE [Hahellaceae bacterium]MCP5169162.1 cell division protein ZapE [Hahellaceae bacterium]
MYTLPTPPKWHYQRQIKAGRIIPDPAQQMALDALENLYDRLSDPTQAKQRVQGLYLWGSVGRGKTFLMDLFTASLKERHYLRLHFHHFMAQIHRQLRDRQGQTHPLQKIACQISQQTKILCFDEFFVSDIGDAMLLGTLIQALFENRVTLVATSNTAPHDLYRDGLQRARFLPAIHAIETHTSILHLNGLKDHRKRPLHHEQIVFIEPRDAVAKHHQRGLLLHRLELPLPDEAMPALSVSGRAIHYVCLNQTTICFTFSQLCEGPRCALDYIDIARRFNRVVILGIPVLSGLVYEQIKARGTEDGSVGSGVTGERAVKLAPSDDATRRFIAVVDEFYERKIKLYLTCQVSMDELYTDGSLLFEFERTRSRLTEMGSREYMELTAK